MAVPDGRPSLVVRPVAEIVVRAARWAGVGAVLFAVAALALYRACFGPAGGLGRQPLASLLVAAFGLAGAVAGATLALTSIVRRAVPEMQARLHALVQPVMTRLIESTRVGRAGVSTERFEQALDAEIKALASAPAPGARFSAAWLLARAIGRHALALVRRLLVREFLGQLRRQGQTQVTPAAVEAFAHEKLVGLLAARVRTQVDTLHWAVWAVSAAMVGGPIAYLFWPR